MIVILLFILGIVIYQFKSQKISDDKHVHYVSDIIRDASYHLRLDEEYKKDNRLREKLNEEIDTEFFKRCKNKTILSFYILEPCNYEDIYHYAESKILLNKLDEAAKTIIINILKKSYEDNKESSVKDYLSTAHNKWTHVLLAMEMLNMLNDSEKKFWVKQYSDMKLNDSQLYFPQTWNRVWLFWDLGIKNYKSLKDYGVENSSKVCNYKPVLQDATQQNIFRERTRIMITKYITIRNFCGQELSEEEKESLRPYFKNDIACEVPN